MVREIMLKSLLRCAHAIDWLNLKAARVATWLVLLACLISAGNAFVRYAFGISSNAWLEIQWYMFAAIVMLGASYTLKERACAGGHIYGTLPAAAGSWLDLRRALLPAADHRADRLAVLAAFHPIVCEIGEMSATPAACIRWPVEAPHAARALLLVTAGRLGAHQARRAAARPYAMDTALREAAAMITCEHDGAADVRRALSSSC